MLWARKKPQQTLPEILLKGARTVLRPPSLEDAEEWLTLRNKNRAFLKPFEPQWPVGTLDTEFYERRMQRIEYNWQLGKGQQFLIFKEENAALIGGMNINNICRGAAQFASIGFWLSENAQGQGYMTEVIHLTLKYAFDRLELHRLNASCLPDNARSKKLLLRCGFTEEGFAKNYLQINGKWQDHILFGLSIESWNQKNRRNKP